MSEDRAAMLLLELRLRAFASTDALAEKVGSDPGSLHSELSGYEAVGWVQQRSGRVSGWTLTAAGRRHGQDLLQNELAAGGNRHAVESAYGDFLPLNAELLSICTDWQTVVVEGGYVVNDHSDTHHDSAVLARLAPLHAAAREVIDRLAGAVDRFSRYGPRLEEAHRNVTAGRTEWLTRVTGESYHGVWFELHEHLLATLGRTREAEPTERRTPTTAHGSSDVPVTVDHSKNGDIQ